MPSTFKHPAHVPMWRGAKVAYLFIAMCLFPVAIGGFWAYGNLVSTLNAKAHNKFTIGKKKELLDVLAYVEKCRKSQLQRSHRVIK